MNNYNMNRLIDFICVKVKGNECSKLKSKLVVYGSFNVGKTQDRSGFGKLLSLLKRKKKTVSSE